jgi:hypothetical protein
MEVENSSERQDCRQKVVPLIVSGVNNTVITVSVT